MFSFNLVPSIFDAEIEKKKQNKKTLRKYQDNSPAKKKKCNDTDRSGGVVLNDMPRLHKQKCHKITNKKRGTKQTHTRTHACWLKTTVFRCKPLNFT